MSQFQTLLSEIDWAALAMIAVRVGVLLFLAWLLVKIVRRLLVRLETHWLQQGREEGEPPSETGKRTETLVRLMRQAITLAVGVLAVFAVLLELGVEIGPVLASAGIVGLAVGFGAQNLVRDVISGFFFILENQVRVGDVAVINGTGGLVERIGFRTIVLRDLTGTVHIFPNGTVTTMANLTNNWSAHVFDIGVAYKENVDRVMEVMKEVGAELRADEKFGPLMVEDIEVFGVDAFADSAVMIKGRLKTKPIQQWAVGREYRRRLKNHFDAEGIEIPFPHRSVHFGEASKPFAAQWSAATAGGPAGAAVADDQPLPDEPVAVPAASVPTPSKEP